MTANSTVLSSQVGLRILSLHWYGPTKSLDSARQRGQNIGLPLHKIICTLAADECKTIANVCLMPSAARAAPFLLFPTIYCAKTTTVFKIQRVARPRIDFSTWCSPLPWSDALCGFNFLFHLFSPQPSRRNFAANTDGIGHGGNKTMLSTERIYRSLTLLGAGLFASMVAAKILVLLSKLIGLWATQG